MHYIYVIRNNVNGKLYVGQANDPKKRWARHKYDAKNNPNKMVISRAINKYGFQNFTFTTIEEHKTLDEINEAEAFWIEFLETRNTNVGYNIRLGGNNAATGTMAWNKGTKGVMKPNVTSFHVKLNWPENNTLLSMVNDKGLGAVALELNTSASNVNHRLKSKNLHHNRVVGYAPETQFKNGTDHPGSKLTPSQVLEIVDLYTSDNYSQTQLGQLFNVSRMTIKKIITGQTWSHLTGIK